jgi:hypothetical protein
MTLQIKSGHGLTDDELLHLEELIQRAYPDEDLVIVYEDSPALVPAQQPAASKAPGLIKKFFVVIITGISGLYLLNPTAGVFEIIPDVIPIIGNLDEATALALLLSGLNFFGINVGWLSSIYGAGLSKRKKR